MLRNWIPYFGNLQWLTLSHDRIEIACHDEDVTVGDQVLWGRTFAEAKVYVIARVTRPPDLDDLWICVCVKRQEPLHMLGRPIN